MIIETVLILVLVLTILNFKITRGKCKSTKRLDGKVVIITGCTSGIGKETARDLANRGAKVIMACRNLHTANIFRGELIRETKNKNIISKHLDLGCFKSIRNFCAEINAKEEKLDILIHNAGTAEAFNKKLSNDGYELTIATNHYGPFLMTHLLIDLMKKSAPSRIVIVASSHYRLAIHNLKNGGNYPKSIPWPLYYLSKYANIMFSNELARRLEGTGVTVNCLHPGLVDTGIWKSAPFPLNIGLKLLVALIFKDCKEGAQTTIHCAVSEELEGISGKYYLDCKEAQLIEGVKDPKKCQELWDTCYELVKLTPNDPKI